MAPATSGKNVFMAEEEKEEEEQQVQSPISDTSSDVVAQTRVKRVFNTAQFFLMSVTFMSSWEAIAGNLYTVFYNGGPQTLVWGFLLVWCGAMAQAASLAEMASVQPIAGAMYHWTYALAPRDLRRLATWLQAWITWCGWISMTVGNTNGTAYWITSLISLNYPSYVTKLWHTTLIIWAQLIILTSVNVYRFGILVPWIESAAGVLHISLFAAFSIALLALAPKNSASFVFFNRVNSAETSGWTNKFVGWNLGLQTSVWAFVGFDAAVHLSEEVKHARNAVPKTMVYTNLINGLMAWLFILVILFCMGNPDEAIKYPQPMVAVLLNATGSIRATTGMSSLLIIIALCSCVVNIAGTARLTWSWARDGGFPKALAYVDEVKRVPARAVLFSTAFVILLTFINFGSSVAFQVFISLSTVAMYISYFMAVLMMVLRRLSPSPPEMGSWSMGRFGMPVNIFALIYTAYVIIWLPFPTTLPITGANFNYSSPVLGFVVLLALGMWMVRRKTWPGLSERIIEAVIKE